MRTFRIGDYTITAWAEKIHSGWHGLASVQPAIPNTWSGGPNGDSLVCDGVVDTEALAEDSAINEALQALREHRPDI